MKMNPEEITAIIKDQIKNYEVDLNVDEVGTVIEIGDGIAHIHGLEKAMAGELLDFGNDIFGLNRTMSVPLSWAAKPRLKKAHRLSVRAKSCRCRSAKP